MYCDYHTHTPLCLHAEGTPAEYVRAAVKAGLKEFGMADHAPMADEPFDAWRMKQAELPQYLSMIQEARDVAAPYGLTVRCGMECDWMPGIEPWVEHIRSLHEWDYLIGSIHYLGEKEEFDSPLNLSFWEHTSVEDAWEQYWERYIQMATGGLFNILGHSDLIKKFGYRPAGDLRRYYEPALQAVKESGVCIELNTSGWHAKCAEQYPAVPFLRMAAQMNIPLTISSDAHLPEHVGRDFHQAAELAYECGFRQLTSFHQGQMSFYPLQA